MRERFIKDGGHDVMYTFILYSDLDERFQTALHKPFRGMVDTLGVHCLVWLYTDTFTQTQHCQSIVSTSISKWLIGYSTNEV